MTSELSQKGMVFVFEPEIRWLKGFLIRNNYEEIADRLQYDWCWEELGKFSKKVPKKVLDLVAREVIKSGDGWACYKYCLYIEDRDDVREALIKSGDGMVCSWYCRNVEDRKDVRAVAERDGYYVCARN